MRKNLQPVLEALAAGVIVFLLTATNLFSALDYIARDGLYQADADPEKYYPVG